MGSRLLIATLTGAIALGAVPAAVFAGTLDQYQEDISVSQVICGPDGIPGGCPLSEAQSFRPAISGLLDRVDLHVVRTEGTDPLTIEIRDVTPGGDPGTDVLASGSISDASSAGWVSVDFDTVAVVQAGAGYAIVAYTGAGTTWAWSSMYDDAVTPYDRGNRLVTETWPPTDNWSIWDEVDFAFRTYVSPSTDLELTMVGPDSVRKGATFTYLLTVSNDGGASAEDVMLTDNLPFGIQYVTATPSQGSCNPATKKVRTVTCDLGSVTANGSVTVAITVKAAARVGSFVNNIASVSGSTFDPSDGNNSASLSTAITR